MWLFDKFIGKPLATVENEGQKIGVCLGLPILGLDGLSSAAYGPEAALAILLPLGSLGLNYIAPVMTSIIVVLIILYFSYRQTIAAYPNGGGSYTVAKENLGVNAGLLAAAALLLDYILNVAVGISAGIGALISVLPQLQPHTLTLCLSALAIITLINLRGVRDTGLFFAAPTYLFISTLLTVIAVGVTKSILSGGHPQALVLPPVIPPPALEFAGLWLLLRSFASGCTAMTGVEAVSNAVAAFKNPGIQNARRTLTAIVTILILLLAGIAYLAKTYQISTMNQTLPGYQTILSQLVAAVMGKGVFYYGTLISIVVVLILSANTSFADFPRLAHMLAQDHYFPRAFANRGRRLVYTMGILLLAAVAGILLVLFHGITEALIPLFAIGAFLAFTLSQAGMVVHWYRKHTGNALLPLIVNCTGAVATGSALIILLSTKFAEGAWICVLLIPMMLLLTKLVKHHYDYVSQKITYHQAINIEKMQPPITVIPIDNWNVLSEHGLRFALELSPEVIAVHVTVDDEQTCNLETCWQQYVINPLQQAGAAEPKLMVLTSPYRLYQKPLFDFILKLEQENPQRLIAVVVPELVQAKWYQYLLHNQRATVLKEVLLREGDRRIIVINMPWYLE
ncbi:MAG: APC family permease [Legionellales bacterium]